MHTRSKANPWTIALTLIFCLAAIPLPAGAKSGPSSVQEAVAAIVQHSKEGLGYMHQGLVRYLHPTRYVQGCLAYRSIDDLLEDSAVIATGKITGQSEAFQVSHATTPSWTQVYTDHYFTTTNVLKGQPYADTVHVRIEGGTVDNYTEVYDCSPQLNQEDEYLLFLRRPTFGGAFETEGDYYTINGLIQGAYVLDSQGLYRNIETQEELPGKVFLSPHLDEEVDEGKARREQLEVYRENYESGFITKEEYDQCVAGMDLYGKIVQ